MLPQDLHPGTDSQRPTRRKFDSSNSPEVGAEDVEIVVEDAFISNKSCRHHHIQSRIRDVQSRRNLQSAQFEEASEAFEMRKYDLAAKVYQEILSSCRGDSSEHNGFQNATAVQMCLNLTECYLHLNSPTEADWVLSQLWRPDGKFTIGATHPLFLETSRLYTILQAQLKGCPTATEKDEQTNTNQEEQDLAEALEIFYVYGYQYLKQGLFDKAAIVYRLGLDHFKHSTSIPGEISKEVAVRMQLALSETYVAKDRLGEACTLLEEVWLPDKPLSIDRHHKYFLWLSRLHAHLRSPGVYHVDVAEPPSTSFSLYQRLGVHHTATKQEIRRAYLTWTRRFHPDKGGDTGVMQQLLEAYQTLAHERNRSKYDKLVLSEMKPGWGM